jgi:hypothetical protein
MTLKASPHTADSTGRHGLKFAQFVTNSAIESHVFYSSGSPETLESRYQVVAFAI